MIRFFTFIATTLLLPSIAFAQNDGAVGEASSQASVTYTLIVTDPPTRIRVSGLEDLNFEYTIGGVSIPEQSIGVCVYISDDSVDTYDLQLQAAPLTDGGTPYPYDVVYADVANPNIQHASTVTDTGYDQTVSGFTANNDDQNCSVDGRPATLRVNIPDASVATTGATAQLTFTVMPS